MRILLAEDDGVLREVMRHGQGADERTQVGALVPDCRVRRFFVCGEHGEVPIDLLPREFEVPAELMTPPGRVIGKKQLADKLSPLGEWPGGNALEAFVSRPRRKLAGGGTGIRTLRGPGCLIEARAEP